MLWLKALHIVFVVCWFAGLFYLPRLFVYHAMSSDAAVHAQLAIMERKLYRFTSIFVVLTVLLGLALVALNPGYYLHAHWFHAKFTLVLGLIAYHLVCGSLRNKLATGTNRRSHVFYRWFNELPVLFLFSIVILAVVKPF